MLGFEILVEITSEWRTMFCGGAAEDNLPLDRLCYAISENTGVLIQSCQKSALLFDHTHFLMVMQSYN